MISKVYERHSIMRWRLSYLWIFRLCFWHTTYLLSQQGSVPSLFSTYFNLEIWNILTLIGSIDLVSSANFPQISQRWKFVDQLKWCATYLRSLHTAWMKLISAAPKIKMNQADLTNTGVLMFFAGQETFQTHWNAGWCEVHWSNLHDSCLPCQCLRQHPLCRTRPKCSKCLLPLTEKYIELGMSPCKDMLAKPASMHLSHRTRQKQTFIKSWS